jgi:hypothetical protein
MKVVDAQPATKVTQNDSTTAILRIFELRSSRYGECAHYSIFNRASRSIFMTYPGEVEQTVWQNAGS